MYCCRLSTYTETYTVCSSTSILGNAVIGYLVAGECVLIIRLVRIVPLSALHACLIEPMTMSTSLSGLVKFPPDRCFGSIDLSRDQLLKFIVADSIVIF